MAARWGQRAPAPVNPAVTAAGSAALLMKRSVTPQDEVEDMLAACGAPPPTLAGLLAQATTSAGGLGGSRSASASAVQAAAVVEEEEFDGPVSFLDPPGMEADQPTQEEMHTVSFKAGMLLPYLGPGITGLMLAPEPPLPVYGVDRAVIGAMVGPRVAATRKGVPIAVPGAAKKAAVTRGGEGAKALSGNGEGREEEEEEEGYEGVVYDTKRGMGGLLRVDEDAFATALLLLPLPKVLGAEGALARALLASAGETLVERRGGADGGGPIHLQDPPATPINLLPGLPRADFSDFFGARREGAGAGGGVPPPSRLRWPEGSWQRYHATFSALLLEEARACLASGAVSAATDRISHGSGPSLILGRARTISLSISGGAGPGLAGYTRVFMTLESLSTAGPADSLAGLNGKDVVLLRPAWIALAACVQAASGTNSALIREMPPLLGLLARRPEVPPARRSEGGAAGEGGRQQHQPQPLRLTLTLLVPDWVMPLLPTLAKRGKNEPAPDIQRQWQVTRLESMSTALSSYTALAAVALSPFAAAVLAPHLARVNPQLEGMREGEEEAQPTRPSALPEPLFRALTRRYDASQLRVILAASCGGAYTLPVVTCGPNGTVQIVSGRKGAELSAVIGPPGTGKTRTILGVLSSLRAVLGAAPRAALASSRITAASPVMKGASQPSLPTASAAAAPAPAPVQAIRAAPTAAPPAAVPAPDEGLDDDIIELLDEEDEYADVISISDDEEEKEPRVPWTGTQPQAGNETDPEEEEEEEEEEAIVITDDEDALPRSASTPAPARPAPSIAATPRSIVSASSMLSDDGEGGLGGIAINVELPEVMDAREALRKRGVKRPLGAGGAPPPPAVRPKLEPPPPVARPPAPPRTVRVLICTPSNAACDEIVARLLDLPAEVGEGARAPGVGAGGEGSFSSTAGGGPPHAGSSWSSRHTGGLLDVDGRPFIPTVVRTGHAGNNSSRPEVASVSVDRHVERRLAALIRTLHEKSPMGLPGGGGGRGEGERRPRFVREIEDVRSAIRRVAGDLREITSGGGRGGQAIAPATTSSRARHLKRDEKDLADVLFALTCPTGQAMAPSAAEGLRVRALVEVLAGADVIATTLSSSVMLPSLVARPEAGWLTCMLKGAPSSSGRVKVRGVPAGIAVAAALRFDAILLDEAGQAIEPEALAPLRLCFLGHPGGAGPTRGRPPPANGEFGCRRLVIVGDPLQLPATVMSRSAATAGLDMSLFERLAGAGVTPMLLSRQYRMNGEIAAFASRHFYKGLVRDAPGIAERSAEVAARLTAGRGGRLHACTAPVVLLDVPWGRETRGGAEGRNGAVSGRSYGNDGEVSAVVAMVSHLLAVYAAQHLAESPTIGVISFYRDQVARIKAGLQNALGTTAAARVTVASVDSFQGQEMDTIIISCVRSSGGGGGSGGHRAIGFLADARRLNVAITRARHSLVLVCNAAHLAASDPNWAALLAHQGKGAAMTLLEQGGRERSASQARPLYGRPCPELGDLLGRSGSARGPLPSPQYERRRESDRGPPPPYERRGGGGASGYDDRGGRKSSARDWDRRRDDRYR
jgi:hypothetical protein